MNHKVELYGLNADERKRLHSIWYDLENSGSQELFGDFENFAKWSAENDFAMGKILVAKDFRKPKGPENAYWRLHGEIETDAEKAARVTLTEHPCIACPQSVYCNTACYLRIKWWDIGMEKLRERIGI